MELDSAEKHGHKRPADNELEGEQRLAKRLGRMRLGDDHSITGWDTAF